MADTPTLALLARLEAKPGKEAEVERFLKVGLEMVQREPGTSLWFGLRLSATTFGIFDTFANEAARQAHLSGEVAKALMAKAPDLFVQSPSIEKAEILAAKLPDKMNQAA